MPSTDQLSERPPLFDPVLLEALPGGLCLCAADGTIAQFNRRASALWGRAPQVGCPDIRFSGAVRLFRAGSQLPHAETPMAVALRSGRPQCDVEVEIERPDGSRSLILDSVELLRDETGRVLGAVSAFVDITARKQSEAELEESRCELAHSYDQAMATERALREAADVREQLVAIVESSDDAIVSKNLDGVVKSWNRGAERLFGFSAEEMRGESIFRLIPPGREDEEVSILDRVRRGVRVEPYDTVRLRKDGSLAEVSVTVSPVRDGTGRIAGASKIARDISERRQAERQRELLLAELNHRVKNSLAIVISIARQTFAGNPEASEELRTFEARLRSLAQSHTRLAETTWAGSALEAIFTDELAPFREHHDGKLRVSGPAVTLGARAAVTLAMAVHELATNAAKHGALSRSEGEVAVDWQVDARRGAVEIEWTERGGPRVDSPERRGFGRLLLEQAVPSELGGEVRLDFAPDGLQCRIRIPVGEPIAWLG